ncbi:hypothetical protein F4782DRAFT_29515 [Xylaria castorea]|nr:hypothetical protein F4782DRAFT_29515 [Xylaria castorea]
MQIPQSSMGYQVVERHECAAVTKTNAVYRMPKVSCRKTRTCRSEWVVEVACAVEETRLETIGDAPKPCVKSTQMYETGNGKEKSMCCISMHLPT